MQSLFNSLLRILQRDSELSDREIAIGICTDLERFLKKERAHTK